MASSIDALPYYDTDIDRVPGLRERLEAQIQQELASTSTSNVDISSRIPAELPPLFASSSFLSSELERVSSGSKATGGLDATRYSLPAPPAGAPAEAWKKAIDNAGAQLEHQQIRLSNLELMQKYAGNSWRVSNFLIEKEIERLGASSEEVRRRTEEINRERKAKQLEAGDRLSSLESRWTTLVSGNLQLELANLTLEMEVDALREREEELKGHLLELQQGPAAAQ